MATKHLGIAILPFLLFVVQVSLAQVVVENKYYDGDEQILWKTYQVSENDPTEIHGYYKEYSRDGVLLKQSYFNNGEEKGKILLRNSNGYIRFHGYYDLAVEFTGFTFSRDTFKSTQLIVDFTNKSKPSYLYPSRQDSILDTLKRKVDKIELLKVTPGFKEHYTEASTSFQNRMSLPKESPEYIKIGDDLIYKYITLIENFTEYVEDEKDINRFLKYSDTLNKKYPELYTDQLRKLAVLSETFNKPLPKLEDNYFKTKQIVRQVRVWIDKIVRLIDLDNQLASLNSFMLASYKPLQYPVLRTKKIEPLLIEINERENQKDLDQRLSRMLELVNNLQVYKDQFSELNPINDKINSRWPDLKAQIQHKFQENWASNTDEITALEDEYQAEENIINKIATGKKFLSAVDELENTYKEASEIQDRIEEYYGKVAERYAKEQPYIYLEQVKPLDVKVADFRNQKKFNSMIDFGKELSMTIYELYINIDTINAHEKTITSGYVNISQLYKEEYPGIYKKDVKTLSDKIDAYQKISNYSNKLSKGRVLIPLIKSYEVRYNILEAQKTQIVDSLKLAISLYKKPFKPIVKIEIRELRVKHKEYTACDTLDKKIAKGTYILNKLSALNNNYVSLKKMDSLLTITYPYLKKNYSKRYNIINKNKIEPLGKKLKEFKASGKLEERKLKGNNLLEQMEEFKTQLNELDASYAKMQKSFDEFESAFINDKPNKIFLKRGKKVYDYYCEQFSNSDSFEKSIKSANQLISFLVKLGSFSNKVNPSMIDKLKQAKTVPAIEAAVN